MYFSGANKRGVILLYKSAMRDFESALSTRLSSCPPYKHAEIRQQQEKLGNFLESVKDRLTKLGLFFIDFSKLFSLLS